MAQEFPVDADLIVPVPDSAIPAAIGYARESGVPFEMALIKNRYIHRTFIRPTTQLLSLIHIYKLRNLRPYCMSRTFLLYRYQYARQ